MKVGIGVLLRCLISARVNHVHMCVDFGIPKNMQTQVLKNPWLIYVCFSTKKIYIPVSISAMYANALGKRWQFPLVTII